MGLQPRTEPIACRPAGNPNPAIVNRKPGANLRCIRFTSNCCWPCCKTVASTPQHCSPTPGSAAHCWPPAMRRSEEHTSELQSLMRNSYAVFCLKKKTVKLHFDLVVQRYHSNNNTIQLKR